jgi:hypothetical protein
MTPRTPEASAKGKQVWPEAWIVGDRPTNQFTQTIGAISVMKADRMPLVLHAPGDGFVATGRDRHRKRGGAER